MHSAQLTSAPTTTASAPTPARMPTIAVPLEEASDGAQEPSFAAPAPGGGVAAGLLRASQVVAGRAGKVNTCEGMARAMDQSVVASQSMLHTMRPAVQQTGITGCVTVCAREYVCINGGRRARGSEVPTSRA